MTDADDPKPALRAMFRRARADFVAGLAPAARTGLEADLARVVAPALAGTERPASYAAVGAEIEPTAIEKRLGPHAFPRVTGGALSFHLAAWADLRPGFGGIPEPAATAPAIVPDLLLVPLLAVTPAGVRLGQGGGYYDRTLATLRSRGSVAAIGLAWDVQIADALPADPWDEALDWVATPTRLFDCRRPR
ncbi:hypothetical protein IP88_05745 [alpha proteobacterium AAP81b]|nr:hypothetical protein IP88_05745 [alpha proteobacterium AAP81b]